MPMTLMSISKAEPTPPYLPARHPHPHEWRCFPLFYPQKVEFLFHSSINMVWRYNPNRLSFAYTKWNPSSVGHFLATVTWQITSRSPKSPVFVQETIRARWCHLTTNNLLSWQHRRLLTARNHAPQSLYLQAQVHSWPHEVLGDQS